MYDFTGKWEADGDCMVWQLYRLPGGYGYAKYKGKNRLAHRLSYEQSVGPIPDGLVLDHLCRNRACINPAHLEPVTRGENNRRGKVLITHCPKGHEYSPENTYMNPNKKSRTCRTCTNEAGKTWRKKRKQDEVYRD